MVAITGQVSRALIGSNAFQEADICQISKPVTKWNVQVLDPEPIPEVIAPEFPRPGATFPDATPALNCGNQTQHDAVRRNQHAWHAEGQGIHPLSSTL